VNAEKKMSQTISNKLELKIAILNSQQNIRRIFVSIAQNIGLKIVRVAYWFFG
jgi:S-adenosylmethionine/arginine decarboxylase-like enzyme